MGQEVKKDAKQDKVKEQKTSRRGFLKTAAVAGAAAGALGFPSVMRLSAAEPIKIKMQTAWDAGTLGYIKFQEFCKKVGEMSEGKISHRRISRRRHRGHL